MPIRGKKTVLNYDGQSVSRADMNNMAAQAYQGPDDAISAVIVPTPYTGGTIARGIIPPGGTLVSANGNGSVKVSAHTAVIGPVDASAAVVTTATCPGGPLAVASGSGNGANVRWDLIYETVVPLNPDTPKNRKVKDITTRVVSTVPTSTTYEPVVTQFILQGTEAATGTNPQPPAVPADPVGGYNIPLAYIRVPGNFNAASQAIASIDIVEIAKQYYFQAAAKPFGEFSSFDGFSPMTLNGSGKVLNTSFPEFMPGSMSGSVSRFGAILVGSSSIGGLPDGAILDNTIDWRNRAFRGTVQTKNLASGVGVAFGVSGTFTGNAGSSPGVVPSAYNPSASSLTRSFMGQSWQVEPLITSRLTILRVDNTTCSWMGGGDFFEICVDGTSGALVLKRGGSASLFAISFVWLEATGQYGNV